MTTVKGYEDYVLPYQNPIAKTMVKEIKTAAEVHGVAIHGHAAQGDNIWPPGTREMMEKIVMEFAAGNDDLEELMDLFDEHWDKAVHTK